MSDHQDDPRHPAGWPPPPFKTEDSYVLWYSAGLWFDAEDPIEADLCFGSGWDGGPVEDSGEPLAGRYATPDEELELLREAGAPPARFAAQARRPELLAGAGAPSVCLSGTPCARRCRR